MTFMRSGRFRIDLGWLVCTSGGRIRGGGSVSAWGRGERNSLLGWFCTHLTPGGDQGRQFEVIWSGLCGFRSCPPRAHLRWASSLRASLRRAPSSPLLGLSFSPGGASRPCCIFFGWARGGIRLFSIYGTSRNREMSRIFFPTANPPRRATRQHRHDSCSLLGINKSGGF